MGYAMASNIRKKMPSSSTLYVYDVYRPSCERFASEYSATGPIVISDSVRDAAARAKTIVSIVPTADNVRQVFLDPVTGLVAAPPYPDRLILECSTIDAASARQVGATLAVSQHGHYIDTPVSVRIFDTSTAPLPVADCLGGCSGRGSRDSCVYDRIQEAIRGRLRR